MRSQQVRRRLLPPPLVLLVLPATAAAACRDVPLAPTRRAQPQSHTAALPAHRHYAGQDWERFYLSHPSARFFKERRYLLREFPVLAQQAPPKLVLEIGCGCGSSLLPVLKANPAATAVRCTGCTDCTRRCLARPAGRVPLVLPRAGALRREAPGR